MKIHFRDLNPNMVEAWKTAFEKEILKGDVEVSQGQLFDVPANAVLSPANSFGFMNGGVDAIIEQKLLVQQTLQDLMREFGNDELLVGEAWIVDTKDETYKFVVSAPTMRVPLDITGTVNVFLAFRAALKEVYWHNAGTALEGQASPIETLLVPGMGTGVGRMDPNIAAQQMHEAYLDANEHYTNQETLSDCFRNHLSLVRGLPIDHEMPKE